MGCCWACGKTNGGDPRDWSIYCGVLVCSIECWKKAEEHASRVPPIPIAIATFAAHIRHLRESALLTVAELAAKSGLRRETVHRYESGDREPSLKDTRRLCKALGISLSVFD